MIDSGGTANKSHNSDNGCRNCGQPFIGSKFAFISAGAMLLDEKDNGSPHKRMEGYLDFGFHSGSKTEKDAILHVGDTQSLGQIEINFCSTTCLRSFLNSCVDKLEAAL